MIETEAREKEAYERMILLILLQEGPGVQRID